MNIKVGDIINEYSLQIYENGKVEKEKDSHNVLIVVEHDKRGQVIAISDNYHGIEVIQTIKDKDKMETSLNDSLVYENKWRCKSLTDSIRAVIHTTQKDDKKVYSKLLKEIEKYLDKEYGKYCSYKIFLKNIEI